LYWRLRVPGRIGPSAASARRVRAIFPSIDEIDVRARDQPAQHLGFE